MREAYGWAMVVAFFMLSFLPLGSPAPEDWGALVRLGMIVAGSAILLANPRPCQPLRRPLAIALGGYALLMGTEMLVHVFALGPVAIGPAALLSFLLAGTMFAALIAGGVGVWREPRLVLP